MRKPLDEMIERAEAIELEKSFPLISFEPSVQAFYEQMRREGTSHTLAEMFALQQPPETAGTDTAFNQGRCNGNQFEKTPWMGDYYKREAVRAGVDTTGKTYLSGLARYPGDPQAWVSDTGDVRRVCEGRGWGCRGAVNVRAQEPTSDHADTPVADDIAEDHVAAITRGQEVTATVRQDIKEEVIHQLKPHWAK